MLYKLPHLHPEIPSVPLASTEWVLNYTSLPFPFFLRCFRLLLPLPQNFQTISHHCVPFRTVAESVLFCALLHLTSLTLTDIRPSYFEWTFLRPASFHRGLPGLIAMLFSPILHHLFCKRASPSSSDAPSFSSSYSCLAAHLFQHTDRALCTSIFLTSFGHTYHVSLHLIIMTIVRQHGQCVPKSRAKLLFARKSIFLSMLLLPNTEWPW